MVDLLIKGGLIIDGSGNPGYHGAVTVEGDTLHTLRGDISHVEAARVIDATGHVVCPGFIDVHSHGGLTILGEPRHEPKVRQGVTTELVGIDGNSAAPFKTREDLERFIELDRGLNGAPPMPPQWLSVGEYLSTVDNKVAVNIALILGNSQVRIWSMGWNDRPATGEELEDMKAVVRESMEEGACGLSTGLDYPPGAYADTNELIELSKVAAAMGGFYHTHTRASLAQQALLAPWEEALDIGRGSDIPVHLTHYRQRAEGRGSHLDFIGLVENARDEGMDVTFDCYPYIYSSTRAIISIPNWAKDGGPERLMEALRSPTDRERLRDEMSSGPSLLGGGIGDNWLTFFRKPHNVQYEGHSLGEIARSRGQDELDAFFDLLLDEELGICSVGHRYQCADPARFRLTSLRHGGKRRHSPGRVPQPPYLRLFPRDPGRVRSGGETPAAARGDPQDDLLRRSALGSPGPGSPAGRHEGRYRGVQPRDRQSPGYAGQPQAVPPGHTLRDIERPDSHRRREAHRGSSGPGAAHPLLRVQLVFLPSRGEEPTRPKRVRLPCKPTLDKTRPSGGSMQESRVDTIVHGGQVVTATSISEGAVAIKGEKIAAVGDPATFPQADRHIDATGKYVLPGLIDCHVHLDRTDGYGLGSIAAAHAGLTTLIPFGTYDMEAEETLPSAINRHREEINSTAVVDFAFHYILANRPYILDSLPQALDMGIKSFKMFMTYKKRPGRMCDDDYLCQAMELVSKGGGMMQLHCESGNIIEYLENKLIAEGHTHPTDFPSACPVWAEEEAINRAVKMGAVTNCPIYVVHLSSEVGLERIKQAQPLASGCGLRHVPSTCCCPTRKWQS